MPQDLPSLLEDSALVLGNRAAEILTAINIGAGFGVAVDEFEAVVGGGGGGLPGVLFCLLAKKLFFQANPDAIASPHAGPKTIIFLYKLE